MHQEEANRLLTEIALRPSAHPEELMRISIIRSVLESNGRLHLWKCERSYLSHKTLPDSQARTYPVYSCRKAWRGSIFAARRAGM
jgi:hypothetical protein